MHLSLHAARTARELNRIFQLRTSALGLRGSANAKLFSDEFDAYPETTNFAAAVGGKVVGALRVVGETELDSPLGDLEELRAGLVGEVGRIATAGMLCLAPAQRARRGLVPSLLTLATYWAYHREYTHIIAGLPADAVSNVVGNGWEAIGAPRKDSNGQLIVPMASEVAATRDQFIQFIREQQASPFTENFTREIYGSGDVIIEKGTTGDQAFVLLNGTVGIYSDYVDAGNHGVRECGINPGEVFGEIALLVDTERTKTVVAESNVDLMVLSRTEFEQSISSDPARAMVLCRLLARRMAGRP